MPSHAEMKAAMQQYVDALSAGDLEAVLALYADDAVVEDPVGAPQRRGKAEIREFYTLAIASGAKLRLTGPLRGSAGNAAAMPLEVEVAPPGAPKMLIGVIETMHFDDAGKIVTMHAYWGSEDVTISGA